MTDIKVEQTQGPEMCPWVRVSSELLQMPFHPQEQRPSWLTQPWTCLSCCSWNSGDGCVQKVCRKSFILSSGPWSRGRPAGCPFRLEPQVGQRWEVVPDFCPREGKCRDQETCSQERPRSAGWRVLQSITWSSELRTGLLLQEPRHHPLNSAAASAELLLRQGQFSPSLPPSPVPLTLLQWMCLFTNSHSVYNYCYYQQRGRKENHCVLPSKDEFLQKGWT